MSNQSGPTPSSNAETIVNPTKPQAASDNDLTAPPTDLDSTQPSSESAVSGSDDVTELIGSEPASTGSSAAPAGVPRDGLTLGDFRLIKKLGEGGMGAVYRATQISLERDVAVKVLSKVLANNKDFVQRFQREAKLMAKIDHPNVLRCYAFGEEKGCQYFAMEFVEGGSLESWMKKLGRLSIGDALRVVIDCCHALEHAHELGLIHRDIKPDNILLTKKGVVKVADLGLAKATSDDMGLTKTGTGAGTPFYMSPEQCRDVKHVDHRSDIYALGVMLYYFLTGQLPFKGETVVELYEAKEKGKFTPARQYNPEIPERLDLILDKCLARKPELRYQSCAELARDLEAFGLANPVLSFIPEASSGSQPDLRPSAFPATRLAPGSAPRSAPKPVVTPQKTPIKPATREPAKPLEKTRVAAPEPDIWYLSFHNKDGKAVKRRMTTAQVLQYIRSVDFDPRAEASKTLDGIYRLLASYQEFEPALRGKITQKKAETRAAKFQAMYAKLQKEEISRQRWRWFRNLFRGTVGWIGFIIYLAVLLGAIAVAIWAFKTFAWDAIDRWFQKMTQ